MDEKPVDPAAPAASGMERRQFERRPLRSTALLALPGQGPVQVQTVDISAGGMGLVGSVNPVPRTACAIRLALPVSAWDRVNIEAQGRITHSVFSSKDGAFKIGMQFVDLPAVIAVAINRYVKG
jgi:c-di-GMP-binding flagellar brake protein YcgR